MIRAKFRWRGTLVLAVIAALAQAVTAAEIKVVTSGTFRAAYLALVPEYERLTKVKVTTEFGASMGETSSAIPMRLKRGEAFDVVIMFAPALSDLMKQGKDVPEGTTRRGRKYRWTKLPALASIKLELYRELKASGDIHAFGIGINVGETLETTAARAPIDFALVAMPYTLLDQASLHTGMTMCLIFILGLVVLPFAPETKGQPLPE